MNHTPTPWRLGNGRNIVSDTPVPEVCGSDAVEYYGGHLVAESLAAENAKFIVRACNSHDALVAALQDILSMAEAGQKVLGLYRVNRRRFDAAQAILAAAGAP